MLHGDRSGCSIVTRSIAVLEHVNLQTAIDAWSREPGRDVVVQGLMLPPHHGGVSLQQLVSGGGHHALRRELNVYRGHVIDLSVNHMGGVVPEFGQVPQTAREDVVVPEPVLARVERHALGVARHRDALLAAGQHLNRGLLLYGPPGTGKTHTTRYLISRMSGSRAVVGTLRPRPSVADGRRRDPGGMRGQRFVR